jgi:hypothetical protein
MVRDSLMRAGEEQCTPDPEISDGLSLARHFVKYVSVVATVRPFLPRVFARDDFPPFHLWHHTRRRRRRLTMEDYLKTLDSVGESILVWADPENKFRGHTEV